MQGLTLDHVARSFGDAVAVRDLSLEVPPGATLGLLGPNGAGKTTTMRMILGIIAPDRGTIAWNGAPIGSAARARFGYLPEERGLYGKQRVREQIAYFARLHGVQRPRDVESADRWLAQLGLETYARMPCSELSKGNQQKVQFACAAVHAPELLILDEPFSGLDPANADVILNALRGLQAAGTTLILSTHQMWQIERVCDTFCIVSHGVVRTRGTLAELRRSWPARRIEVEPATPALRGVLDGLPELRMRPSPAENGESRVLDYEVPADADVSAILRRLVEAGSVTRFERMEPSLEDLYRRATSDPA